MPAYLDPIGQPCSHSDAHANGRLRPGYRSVLGNGERLSFDIDMTDSKPQKAVYLVDTAKPDDHAQSARVRDIIRDSRYRPVAETRAAGSGADASRQSVAFDLKPAGAVLSAARFA